MDENQALAVSVSNLHEITLLLRDATQRRHEWILGFYSLRPLRQTSIASRLEWCVIAEHHTRVNLHACEVRLRAKMEYLRLNHQLKILWMRNCGRIRKERIAMDLEKCGLPMGAQLDGQAEDPATDAQTSDTSNSRTPQTVSNPTDTREPTGDTDRTATQSSPAIPGTGHTTPPAASQSGLATRPAVEPENPTPPVVGQTVETNSSAALTDTTPTHTDNQTGETHSPTTETNTTTPVTHNTPPETPGPTPAAPSSAADTDQAPAPSHANAGPQTNSPQASQDHCITQMDAILEHMFRGEHLNTIDANSRAGATRTEAWGDDLLQTILQGRRSEEAQKEIDDTWLRLRLQRLERARRTQDPQDLNKERVAVLLSLMQTYQKLAEVMVEHEMLKLDILRTYWPVFAEDEFRWSADIWDMLREVAVGHPNLTSILLMRAKAFESCRQLMSQYRAKIRHVRLKFTTLCDFYGAYDNENTDYASRVRDAELPSGRLLVSVVSYILNESPNTCRKVALLVNCIHKIHRDLLLISALKRQSQGRHQHAPPGSDNTPPDTVVDVQTVHLLTQDTELNTEVFGRNYASAQGRETGHTHLHAPVHDANNTHHGVDVSNARSIALASDARDYVRRCAARGRASDGTDALAKWSMGYLSWKRNLASVLQATLDVLERECVPYEEFSLPGPPLSYTWDAESLRVANMSTYEVRDEQLMNLLRAGVVLALSCQNGVYYKLADNPEGAADTSSTSEPQTQPQTPTPPQTRTQSAQAPSLSDTVVQAQSDWAAMSRNILPFTRSPAEESAEVASFFSLADDPYVAGKAWLTSDGIRLPVPFMDSRARGTGGGGGTGGGDTGDGDTGHTRRVWTLNRRAATSPTTATGGNAPAQPQAGGHAHVHGPECARAQAQAAHAHAHAHSHAHARTPPETQPATTRTIRIVSQAPSRAASRPDSARGTQNPTPAAQNLTSAAQNPTSTVQNPTQTRTNASDIATNASDTPLDESATGVGSADISLDSAAAPAVVDHARGTAQENAPTATDADTSGDKEEVLDRLLELNARMAAEKRRLQGILKKSEASTSSQVQQARPAEGSPTTDSASEQLATSVRTSSTEVSAGTDGSTATTHLAHPAPVTRTETRGTVSSATPRSVVVPAVPALPSTASSTAAPAPGRDLRYIGNHLSVLQRLFHLVEHRLPAADCVSLQTVLSALRMQRTGQVDHVKRCDHVTLLLLRLMRMIKQHTDIATTHITEEERRIWVIMREDIIYTRANLPDETPQPAPTTGNLLISLLRDVEYMLSATMASSANPNTLQGAPDSTSTAASASVVSDAMTTPTGSTISSPPHTDGLPEQTTAASLGADPTISRTGTDGTNSIAVLDVRPVSVVQASAPTAERRTMRVSVPSTGPVPAGRVQMSLVIRNGVAYRRMPNGTLLRIPSSRDANGIMTINPQALGVQTGAAQARVLPATANPGGHLPTTAELEARTQALRIRLQNLERASIAGRNGTTPANETSETTGTAEALATPSSQSDTNVDAGPDANSST